MGRYLAVFLVVFFLPVIALGGTNISNVPLFGFMLNGTKLGVTREVMAVNWMSDGSDRADLSPPKVRLGKTILMRPSPGGVRPGGDLGSIQRSSHYLTSLQQAYRQAVKQTEGVPKNGILEINRLVGGTIPNADDGYSASMAVHFMAMFRSAIIPDNSILIGTLQPDGRIGAVSLLSAKVVLLIPYSQKLFIPSGQLTTLEPAVTNLLEQRQVTVEEVDTIEQAYQLMVRTR